MLFRSRFNCQVPVFTAQKLRKMIDVNDIASLKIESIRQAFQRWMDLPEIWKPETRETADHSLPCTVAMGLIDGTITPAMMSPPSTPPSTITESNLTDLTDDCLQSTSLCTGSNTQTSVASSLLANKGWYVTLSNSGEKVIAPATTSAGTVIFNTNQPKQDTVTGSGSTPNVGPNAGNYCTSDLGTARQYGLDYQDATSNNIYDNLASQYRSSSGRYATFAGGGFLPAPVPVVVQIDGKYYQTVISGVQATNPGGLTLQTRVRSYWYKQTQ